MKDEVQEFINSMKASKNQNKLRNIFSTGLIWFFLYEFCLFVASFEIVKSIPIILVASLMISVCLGIALPFKFAEVREIYKNRKLKKDTTNFLQNLANYTRKTEDYKPINLLMAQDNASDYVIELSYFIYLHFQGTWLNKEKLIYNKEWGSDFWEKSLLFFENQKPSHKDLSDILEQATWLATVKRENVQQMIDHFDNLEK